MRFVTGPSQTEAVGNVLARSRQATTAEIEAGLPKVSRVSRH